MYMDRRINAEFEQVASSHNLANRAKVTLSDIEPGGTRDHTSLEEIIVKRIDLENEINADIDSLVDLKTRDHDCYPYHTRSYLLHCPRTAVLCFKS